MSLVNIFGISLILQYKSGKLYLALVSWERGENRHPETVLVTPVSQEERMNCWQVRNNLSKVQVVVPCRVSYTLLLKILT